MSSTGTSTVIFAWAALIALWVVVFIFNRRLRADRLESQLNHLLSSVRTLAQCGQVKHAIEIMQIETAIQRALQLSEVWSGSVVFLTGRIRALKQPHEPVALQLGARIGQIIARHIVCGCPLLWPALLIEPWRRKIEARVIAICFVPESGDGK